MDDKEHSGDACYFEKDNSSPASGEAYNGTLLYVVGCDISVTLRTAPSTTAAEIARWLIAGKALPCGQALLQMLRKLPRFH